MTRSRICYPIWSHSWQKRSRKLPQPYTPLFFRRKGVRLNAHVDAYSPP